ncbi:MAG: hypothetical protein AAF549_05725 [Pseudomonadota bacterium]
MICGGQWKALLFGDFYSQPYTNRITILTLFSRAVFNAMIAAKCQLIYCFIYDFKKEVLFMSEDKKVIGIPVHKYTKVCYILILVSGAFGLFTSLLALMGMYPGFGGVFGVLGLVGFGLAVTGFLAFSEEFDDLDLSHFKLIIILFVVFFIFNMIFFNALGGFGAIGSIISLLISVAQFAILFAAYRGWQASQKGNFENLKTQLIELKSFVASKISEGPKKPKE